MQREMDDIRKQLQQEQLQTSGLRKQLQQEQLQSSTLRSQVAQMEKEMKRVRDSIEELQGSHNASSQQELDTVRGYLRRANDEITRLRDRERDLQEQVRSLTVRLETRDNETEVTELSSQLQLADMEIQRLKTFQDSHQVEVDSLRTLVRRLKEEKESVDRARLAAEHERDRFLDALNREMALNNGNANPTTPRDSSARRERPTPPLPPTEQRRTERENPFFGLEVADGIKVDVFGSKQGYGAVKVVKVWGPAQRAGILPYDFITRINNATVATLADFNRCVDKIRPNEIVQITLEREGQTRSVHVRTEATSARPGRLAHPSPVMLPAEAEDILRRSRESARFRGSTPPLRAPSPPGARRPSPGPVREEVWKRPVREPRRAYSASNVPDTVASATPTRESFPLSGSEEPRGTFA